MSFVTRSGSQLLLNGQVFRFSGPNLPWIGTTDWAHSVIDDALQTCVEMGATAFRAHTLGISTGTGRFDSIEPSLDNFNSTVFDNKDYAIYRAGQYGLKIIIPFTDNWHYDLGGKHDFTDWYSVPEANFYTDTNVIGAFERYIHYLLTHINPYTGLAWKDDPAIMAWETGNELSAPSSWTQTIAAYIKSIDSNHLVMNGTSPSVFVSGIDIQTYHFYPPNDTTLTTQAATYASQNLAFIIGEFDWTNDTIQPIGTFLSQIESTTSISGSLYWAMEGHSSTSGFISMDSPPLKYPGEDSDKKTRCQQLRVHSFNMRGVSLPASHLFTPSPTITSISKVSGNNVVKWRGRVGAATYDVERSVVGASGPWIVISTASDFNVPFTDNSTPSGNCWYRVRPYNLDGVACDYSLPFSTQSNTEVYPNGFVYRNGNQLLLNGQKFRFVGGNSYDLGDVWITHFEIDDTFKTYKEMGLSVMRVFTVGQSFGYPGSVMPSAGVFDDTRFTIRDYLISQAENYGIKLILSFFSNWPGNNSRYVIQDWLGLSSQDDFYTDSGAIALEQQYISHMLNHVNQYTGIAWKDDPSILCWETGNEMRVSNSVNKNNLVPWTNTMTDYIKSIDINHIVMDGTDQNYFNLAVTSKADIVTAHYYSNDAANVTTFTTQAQLALSNNKVFIVGEYDWGYDNFVTTAALTTFLSAIESNNACSGDLFWELHGHALTYGFRDPWPSALTMHYPDVTTYDRANKVQLIRSHSYRMSNLSVPAHALVSAPTITKVVKSGYNNQVQWQGSAGASTYDVEFSLAGPNGPFSIICNKDVNDTIAPYTDTTTPLGKVWYRVKPYNLDGVAGPYSPVLFAQTASTIAASPFIRVTAINSSNYERKR